MDTYQEDQDAPPKRYRTVALTGPCTDPELAAIAARADAATAGPWDWTDWDDPYLASFSVMDHECDDMGYTVATYPLEIISISNGQANTDADAEFIAAAREDIPRLLATIAALKAGKE